MYSTNCPFDIATTIKYDPKKRECCIVSRMNIPARTMLTGLCGMFYPLADDFLRNLKDNECDFSVMYSQTTAKEGIFVGPARFVNHDCDPNCEVSLFCFGSVVIVFVVCTAG